MKNLVVLVSFLVAGITSLSAQSIYSGKWESDSFFITFEGSWKIEKEGDKTYVVMGDDFDTKKAPDLKIYLSKLNFKEISADNASDANTSVFVAQLTSYEGAKKYLVPSNITISDYKTILVHCEKYTKYWGGSPLK